MALFVALVLSAGISTAPPVFQFVLRDGTLLAGPLSGLDTDSVRSDNQVVGMVPRHDLLEIYRSLPALPTEHPFILLANGDRLPGEVITLQRHTVTIRLASLLPNEEWTIPHAAWGGSWWQRPVRTPEPERFRWRWQHETPSLDRLQLTNGDLLQGAILRIENGGWQISTSGGTFTVPSERLAYCRRPAEKQPLLPPAQAIVTLTDDTRLSFTDISLLEGYLAGRTVYGHRCRFPVAVLQRLEFSPAQTVPLASLVPITEKHEAYFDLTLPWVRNGDVFHRPLRAEQLPCEHGLGMMTSQEVTYALDSVYHTFRAYICLPQPLPGRSPEITVLVDGVVRTRLRLSAERPTARIWLTLSQAQRLTLRAEHGSDSDGPSAINWLEPCLLK